ncbi:MAG TPA: DMT family transporter [bacterium]|nr:DMT family transporter [bacterium]
MRLRQNGLLLMLLSDLFFAFVPITVKWVHALGCSAVEVTFFRFTFGVVGALALAAAGFQTLRVVKPGPLFWRGFFGGLAVFFYFISLDYTTAGRATLWNYTYSIWANVFSIFLLKRPAPRHFAWMLALGALGVFLVLGVGPGSAGPGDLAGLLSGASAGASVVAIKEARRTDNSLSIFMSFSLFGSLFAGAFLAAAAVPGAPPLVQALGGWGTVAGRGLGLLALLGLLGMAAQLFLTQALGHLSLSMGTLLSLLVPVGAALFGLLLLGEPLTPHFLAGTFLVLAACAWLGFSERPDPA